MKQLDANLAGVCGWLRK